MLVSGTVQFQAETQNRHNDIVQGNLKRNKEVDKFLSELYTRVQQLETKVG